MANLAKNTNSDISPDIKPDLYAGNQSSAARVNNTALNNLEGNASVPVTGSASEREGQAADVTKGAWQETVSKAAETSAKIASGGKSKSPMVAILIILFGGGLTFGGLFGALSLLPINVVSRFFEVGDTQNTSFTIRTERLINAKVSKDITTSCTNISLLKCRYTRPSNKLLKAMEREGITALNSKGEPIQRKTAWPNERPAKYQIKNPDGGKPIIIDAKDFSGALKKNPVMRAAFHRAYTPRFIGYADKIFQSIKTRFGFNSSDKFKDSRNSTDVGEKLNETSGGSDTGARAAASGTADEADNVAKKLITETVTAESNKVAKAGRGNAVGIVSGVACVLGDIPGIVIKTVRVYQLAQLIKYGSAILSAVGAMKAGDATPEAVTAIGDLFTQTVDGKSAMDSFGIKSVLYGDITPGDSSYKKFIPGASVIGTLGDIARITDSAAKKEVCRYATNPVTGAAIDAVTSWTLVGPLINIGVGVAISVAMEQLLPTVIKAAAEWLSDSGILKSLLSYFLGDLTKDLVPNDRGNAFASSALNLMGQTANAGANMPLSVADAIAYEDKTKEVQLAYAEEDRATLSPLDATNSNTLLGSFVSQLLPYYSKLSSVSGVFSTIGSIVGGSLSRVTNTYADTANPEKYTMCTDPALSNVAAGPFCNIIYGIPPKYLDKDPEAVLDRLIADGDIDADTGEPIDKNNALTDLNPEHSATGNLKGWIDLCTDGTTSQAENCKLTDATADYALYVIDHRIQQTMDGEDEILENGTDRSATTSLSSSSTSNASSITVVVNKKHPLSPTSYVPASLVDIASDVKMRSEAASAFNTMKTAAASAGNTLAPISGYRSYDNQVKVYNGWVRDLGSQAAADRTSARPGHSEYQTGLAIDINTVTDKTFANQPAGQWLAANSYKYGFILRYPNGETATTGYDFEPWHYRYIGIGPATEMYGKGITTLEKFYNITGGDYAYTASSLLDSLAIIVKRYSFA